MTQDVFRRRVFYIPGFDPFPPRRYRELYRTESQEQARIIFPLRYFLHHYWSFHHPHHLVVDHFPEMTQQPRPLFVVIHFEYF
jgi:hypothetical protein